MSKTRKLLSVLVALAMVLSVFAVTASAYGYEAEDAEYTQTWALSEPVDNGNGTWTVNVSLTTNYPTGVIQFVVSNTDPSVAALTNVTLGSAIPAAYGASISKNLSSGKVMILVDTEGDETIEASAINGVIATLTYTYSGSGSADIAIKNDPKSETNVAGSLIAARMDNGDLVNGDQVVGQTVTSTGETRTIGSAKLPADLALKAAGTTAGIVIDTNKTFGGAYAGVVYGFAQAANNTFMNTNYLNNNLTATNDGTLVYGRSIGTSGYGTGTTITVKNSDGSETGKVYVVVIFGDVDGNGLINTSDANATKNAVADATIAPTNSVKRLAANCQNANVAAVMHNINTADANAIKSHIGGTKIDAAALAAKHASFTTYYK